jgi:chromosomal replication initiation ATPase DnaA
MPQQLPLPFAVRESFAREDFLIGPGNREAVAFLDAWPDWPAPHAVLFGPPGSGKTHLAHVWAAKAAAAILDVSEIGKTGAIPQGAVAIENAGGNLSEGTERTLFALIERRTPLLLTGREPPGGWPAVLPDLTSRFRSLLAFGLWAPDDALLEGLAKKLFSVRQLLVPEQVAREMVRALERSPAAIRAFVTEADTKALAEKRPVNLALVRELLAKRG